MLGGGLVGLVSYGYAATLRPNQVHNTTTLEMGNLVLTCENVKTTE
jgi:hypothetical protein